MLFLKGTAGSLLPDDDEDDDEGVSSAVKLKNTPIISSHTKGWAGCHSLTIRPGARHTGRGRATGS